MQLGPSICSIHKNIPGLTGNPKNTRDFKHTPNKIEILASPKSYSYYVPLPILIDGRFVVYKSIFHHKLPKYK